MAQYSILILIDCQYLDCSQWQEIYKQMPYKDIISLSDMSLDLEELGDHRHTFIFSGGGSF